MYYKYYKVEITQMQVVNSVIFSKIIYFTLEQKPVNLSTSGRWPVGDLSSAPPASPPSSGSLFPVTLPAA